MHTRQAGDTRERGFVSDPRQWVPEVASTLAEADGLALTDAHWVVLNTIRAFYDANDVPPSRHVVCQQIEKAGTSFTYNCAYTTKHLFPSGGLKQAARIAGVPAYFCQGCC
ncbi:MAG: TusE/DsrC/DsvC family sulfur relay protein [Chromatiaceae bacterium]